MTYEFEIGDVISCIGDTRKFLVLGVATQFGKVPCYILCEYKIGVDYRTMSQIWLEKNTCEGDFVLVGTYDFQNKKEFAEREGGR